MEARGKSAIRTKVNQIAQYVSAKKKGGEQLRTKKYASRDYHF